MESEKGVPGYFIASCNIGYPTFSKEDFPENTALLHKKILPGCGEYFKILVKIPG
jgi:hypothetical protein